ncbi:UNVERIFIED_ORG: hypothetical protein M2328_005733 [Rhodococcus erythropolis]
MGKDDIALIVGDVFSRDMVANPRDTLARVSEAITHLSEAGLLHRYTANGKPLVYISNWDSLQRIDKPGKGRLPRPDGTMDYKESIIRESVASPREGVAPGTGEQGNRGTEEQFSLVADSPPRVKPDRNDRDDVARLCAHLLRRIEENGLFKVPPVVSKEWKDHARLLLDTDKVSEDEAIAVIDWCQSDSFWAGNILSMKKFRAQFPTLLARSGVNGKGSNGGEGLGGW